MTIVHMRACANRRGLRIRLATLTTPVLLCAALACKEREADPEQPQPAADAAASDSAVRPERSLWLADSDMSEQERTSFLHMSQGSELLPVDWLLALRTSSGERFLQLDHPGYGLLAGDADPAWNPRGLPLGMSAEPPATGELADVAMFGFNCAACHVGEVRAEGRTYRIVGAPNLFDIDAFLLAFFRHLTETAQEPLRRTQFIHDLQARQSATLEPGPANAVRAPAESRGVFDEFLRNFRADLRPYVSARLTPGPRVQRTDAGFGRVDAFNAAHNRLFPRDTAWDLTAPVDFPRLWNLAEMHHYHWDGNDTSILQRNVGEAIGLGAAVDPATFASSVRLANLLQLEALAQKIEPPAWPFASPDAALVERGAGLFGEHCQSCHDRESGKREDVGTDANRHQSFSRKLQDGTPFHRALEASLISIIDRACASAGTSVSASDCAHEPSAWSAPPQYLARTLAGVWATAPYLHNGSVPTLAALLERDRPAQFAVGSRELDLEHVGYVESSADPARMRDTSQAGNQNHGHAYGVDLQPDEKQALIAFLKTLH